MTLPEPAPQADTLRRLATLIEGAGLRVPVSMILDTLRPVDFLCSQAALLVQPFAHGSSWERYATVLTHEATWDELRRLLHYPHR
jgi:hypothetical protein